MYKILIVDNIPSLNKGEMAILYGILESFRTLGKVDLSVFSIHPDVDASRYNSKVKVIGIGKYLSIKRGFSGQPGIIFTSIIVILQHLFFLISYKILGSRVLKLFKAKLWRAYLDSDIIILGHDGAFGIKWTPVYFYPLFMPFFVKSLRKISVLYGGSIAKSRRLFARILRSALDRMHLITLRESMSYQNVMSLGLQGNSVFLTADLAFLLKAADSGRIWQILRREALDRVSGPLIGMTMTRRMAFAAFPDIQSPERRYHKHSEMIASVVDELTYKLDAKVVFVPHCIGFGDELDDRIVARDILHMCKNKENVRIITNEYDAAELKGLIGQLDMFIGERLHSVIAAMTMCVPAIAISYSSDPRLAIVRMLGQDYAICRLENLDSESLLLKINHIWSRREAVSCNLRPRVETLKKQAMLNGRLLKQLLNSGTVVDESIGQDLTV